MSDGEVVCGTCGEKSPNPTALFWHCHVEHTLLGRLYKRVRTWYVDTEADHGGDS